MRKILFLLLVTISSYGQSLQNPTFGTVKSMTAPTVSTTPTLGTIEANGTISKIVPNNVPITYTPINYAPSSTSIVDQIAGIDARLGQIGNVTAGVTTRVHLTGDNITVTAGTFFASNTTGKGATAAGTPQQTLSNNDDQKQYFTKDVMSVAVPALTTAPPGVYSGQLTVSSDPTPGTSKQRFTIEIYKTNNGGTPISSGITGAPVGALGVTVVAILDSGLINVVAGSLTNIGLQGNLASTLTLNTGERLRYHVSAEKVGTDGGAVTMNVYYGSNYNSYYDIPVTFRASTVLNDSGVSGQYVDDALNSLDNRFLGKLNDRGGYNASSNLFPTTGGSGPGGSIMKGDIWYVTVRGVLGGKAIETGDSFRALFDSPGQTQNSWAGINSNIGFEPANNINVIHKTLGGSGETATNTINNYSSVYSFRNTSTGSLGGLTSFSFYTDNSATVGFMFGKHSLSHTADPNTVFFNNTSTNGRMAFFTDSNERLSISSTGNVKINSLAGSGDRDVVADSSGNLKIGSSALSGSYTPTVTAGSNLSSVTLRNASYIQSGNIVTVTISVTLQATATNNLTNFTATVPINRVSSTVTDYFVGHGAYYFNTIFSPGHSVFISNNLSAVTFTFNSGSTVGSSASAVISFQYDITK